MLRKAKQGPIAALPGEADLDLKLHVPGVCVPAMGADEALGTHDLAIDDLVRIVCPVRSMRDGSPDAVPGACPFHDSRS